MNNNIERSRKKCIPLGMCRSVGKTVIFGSRAESPAINSTGQRPVKRNAHQTKALQGRNRDVALAGLPLHNRTIFRRVSPYTIGYKGFALPASRHSDRREEARIMNIFPPPAGD